MNDFKIHKDRLFPKFNGVSVQSLKIDFDCVSFVTPPNDAKKTADIAQKHIKKYKSVLKEITVVDATACVGGDTITLCSIFGKVISIELELNRYNNLVHNISQYKFTNVELLNGDSTTIIPKLPIVDIIFMDVPWGGRDYKLKQKLRLNFGAHGLEQFILNCFDKKITQSQPKLIISKMPKNYDIEYLYTMLSQDFDVALYELKKMNIIVVEKRDINVNYDINSEITEIKHMVTNMVDEMVQNVIDKLALNTFTNTKNIIWDSTDDFCLNAPKLLI